MAHKIAPSILASDFSRLADEVSAVELAGADMLHIDIMDGVFVPPISFGQVVVSSIRKLTSMHFDVHLMVQHPEACVDSFIEAGADTLTFHFESTPHSHRLLEYIRSRGIRAGISINPGTPVSVLDSLLSVADQVLVMTVNPGWGGQSFIQECLDKVRVLSKVRKERKLDFDIEVDGGVSEVTGLDCVNAGANILVAGTYVFGSSDYRQQIESLR